MTVTQASGSVIVQPGQQIPLSSLFTLGTGLPATIGIDLLDDGNYTLSNPGALGYLSGNGTKSTVSVVDSNGKEYSYVLFQYDAAKGEYFNSALGYWNDITVAAPTGNDHATLLTVFSFKNGADLSLGNLNDLGDLSLVSESAFANPFPGATAGQATPNEICSIAMTYVGKVWNSNGCALLVQDIAGLAGANVPFNLLSSSASPQNPFLARASGEWIVAYDGEAQANPSAAAVEALIRPGDIINLGWPGGGGHTTTVVSGSGANALVIDNLLDHSAHDGSPNDVVIQPPHSLDDVLQAAIPSTIQVYRLDTPVISVLPSAPALNAKGQIGLASLIAASDPGGKAITAYQIDDSASGITSTVSSLAAVSLTNGADVVQVRGFNGTYWGDWQSVTVTPATGAALVDTAQNVLGSLDNLAGLAAKGTISSIALTDGGIPGLTVSAAQFSADSAALTEIATAHTVTVQMNGAAAGHDFTGENWIGASALQFSDRTVIVAATPGAANAVTTGNVTELYSAVLAREPDLGGLAFYQNYLKANPGTPLQTFADYFLNSAEYKNSHDYAAGTAGDTQFIVDSYQNLLHRTPSADEVNFYLANVMSKPDPHALMLVYFSASSEFLKDVQITASNPAGAQHWLVLT